MNVALNEKFKRRYFEWSLNDAEREIREDFPLLRLVKCDAAEKYIALLSKRTPEQRLEIARLFVKNGHRYSPGVGFSLEEKTQLDLLEKEFRMDIPRPMTPKRLALHNLAISAAAGNQEAMNLIIEMKKRANPSKLLPRRQLQSLVSRQMSKSFGNKPEKWPGGELIFTSYVNHITVKTYFDFPSLRAQLSYWHSISDIGDIREMTDVGIQTISILSWLGIGSRGDWNDVTKDNASSVIDIVQRICKHFLDATNDFLAD